MQTLRRLLALWRLYATLDILFITRSANTAIPWYVADIIIGLSAITALFNSNVAFISRRIGRGQLDHILIQPQPLWMALLTEGFAPVTGAGMLVSGVGLLVWSLPAAGVAVSPAWLALLMTNLIAS